MNKPPAFLLYAADFYMDTNTWTIQEIGIYTRLLFSEWVNGPLPNDETRLARAAGCTVKVFRAGWCQVKLKFAFTDDDKLYNERLEIVRQEQKEYQEKQSLKGQKSAEKRWGKKVTTVTTAVTTDAQPKSNSSSSSSNKESINTLLSAKRTCPHSKIIEEYNRTLGPYLPEVKESLWGGKRASWLKARWKEKESRQKIEWWTGYFEYIRDNCKFLTGENDRAWKADLEWVIKAENMVKIIEGKYQKQGRKFNSGNGSGQPRVLDGAAPGAGEGKESHSGPAPPHGGKGTEAPTVPMAADGRGRHGEAEKGE